MALVNRQSNSIEFIVKPKQDLYLEGSLRRLPRVSKGDPYPCQMQKNQSFSCLFRHYAKHNGLRKEDLIFTFVDELLPDQTPESTHLMPQDEIWVEHRVVPSESEKLPDIVSDKLAQDIGTLLITGDHADITFKFKETNQSIPAHRAILSARSTYFEAMFKGNMRESYESEIVIDASRSIFYKLLQFIYTNEVDRLETCEISDIIDLLILSNIYSLDSLRTYCEKVLARLITCENISQLLLICVHHDAELLKEACVKFVEDNKKELSKNADFRREIEAAPEVGFILLFDAKLPKFSDCLSSDVDVQDTKRRRVSTESTANTINNNTDGHDTPVGQTVVPPQISLTNNITNSNEDNN